MKTKFDEFWEREGGPLHDKEFAKMVWHAAHKAAVSTLFHPPFIPKVGDRVRNLSMCHGNILNRVQEVIRIEKEPVELWYLEGFYSKLPCHTDRGHLIQQDVYTGGLLGEVELVE
jgi:hypothetical protein